MDGKEHAITAVKTHKETLNGADDLDIRIYPQNNRSVDLSDISEVWGAYDPDTAKDYKIVHLDKVGKGDGFHLRVRAAPEFFWDFDKSIIHKNHDGHNTPSDAFNIVFAHSGYNSVLVDLSRVVRSEGYDRSPTRFELFEQISERYNHESDVSGNTVYMRHRTGVYANFDYRYALNGTNISNV